MKPILFLSISAALLCAQSWKVSDPSGRPLEGASVACGSETRLSGARGEFQIPAGCAPEISKPGFETQTTDATPKVVALRLAVLSERVVVTATGAAATLDDAGLAASIYTSRDFAPHRAPFIADLLRDTPGLNVVQGGGPNGGITSVFARGGNSDSALVLLDGVPLTEPGGRMDFANLSTSGISRMEVVRGPASNIFGPEASSAIIQMFSRQGDPEARVPHGSLAYERGSFSTDRWSAALDGGLGNRFDYALTSDQNRSTGQFANNTFRLTSGTANLGFRVSEKTSVRGIYRQYDAFAGSPGQTAYKLYNLDAQGLTRASTLSLRVDDTRGARFTQRALFGYHRNRYAFEDRNQEDYTVAALVDHVSAGPTYFRRLLDAASNPGIVPGFRTVVTPVSLYPFSSVDRTTRTSGSYQGTLAHSGGSTVFGYRFEEQAGRISLTDVARRNNGFYVQEQYALTSRISLSGGARHERSSAFGNQFAPRGAVAVRLPGQVFVRVSGGRGIKEPALVENFARETFYVGNPKLKPARTDSFEVGLSREWLGGRIRSDINWFRNSFKNLIVFDFSSFPSTWQNVDRSWARGVEISASGRIARALQVRAEYAKLHTRITASSSGMGQELLRRPRNSGAVSLEFAPQRFVFTAGGRFVGDRRDADFLFPVNRNPGYRYVFAGVSWQATRHLMPYARVDNAFHESYQEALGYQAFSRFATGGLRVAW